MLCCVGLCSPQSDETSNHHQQTVGTTLGLDFTSLRLQTSLHFIILSMWQTLLMVCSSLPKFMGTQHRHNCCRPSCFCSSFACVLHSILPHNNNRRKKTTRAHFRSAASARAHNTCVPPQPHLSHLLMKKNDLSTAVHFGSY